MKSKVVSESTELVYTDDNGVELWVEHVTSWPNEKRRGRKPASKV